MDDRVFRRVQRYGWDAASEAYDAGWVDLLRAWTARCVDRAALRPGERVLDLATGPGVAAFLAAERVGPRGIVSGMDISERMVALARARPSPVRFERGDMEETGASPGALDAVTCAFGLMYAADKARALAEMHRILAPGGRVSLCVWGRRSACAWAEVFPIIDRRVESEVCPLFFALGVPGALALALERAGFGNIAEERIPMTLDWPSAEAAVRDMLEGGAVALAWRRFSPEIRRQVGNEYLASIESFRQGTHYRVPSEILFVTAERRVP